MKHGFIRVALFGTAVSATLPLLAQQPLPPNYHTVISNADVLVQQVHYAPHETVPMHDHPAVTTVYVYLNNDQGFIIHHEGHEAPVHRPPSHAGAFRVSPGNLERHSIENPTDSPSDFVRVELRKVPVHTIHEEFRGAAPIDQLSPGLTTEYSNPLIRVDRIICSRQNDPCTAPADPAPSVLVRIPPTSAPVPTSGLEQWLPATKSTALTSGGPGAQYIRILLTSQ